MAIRAGFGSGLVKQDRLALNVPLLSVALRAGYVCVATSQWKLRALVVVKGGGGPALIDVAIRALRDSILSGKLCAVRVRVATLAILRRACKLNFMRTGERLVAFVACNRAMCADQREFRFGMVESTNIDPRARVVAGLASERGAIGALLRHAVFKFAFVGIGMAGGAGAVLKMEWQDLVGSSAEAYLVAFGASNGYVSAGQHETGVLMLGNREGRTMEVLYGMAILAAVLIRRGGKLLVMRVLVAVQTGRELHFVQSVFSGGSVAFVASDGRVFPLEWIVRRSMLFHPELRWLPALDGVALGAFSFARACFKLAFVRIGSVANGALVKGQRLFEIARRVAFGAANFHVHSKERIFCC